MWIAANLAAMDQAALTLRARHEHQERLTR